MTDTWAPGDRGRVTGPLSGEAVVEEVLDFDAIKVRVSFFGRATVTTVRPDQFVGEGGERRGLPPPARELRRSLSALDARLGPGKGAGHDELDELRRRLSPCSLPEDLATVLSWRAGGLRLGRNTELVGPASVAELKAMMDGHGAAGRFDDWRPGEWWNAGWIPFTREPGEGTAMLVLDTAGTFGGQPGQILAWDRHPARPVVAESLAALFAAWCEGLERGIVEASGGVLAPVSGQEPRWERFRRWLQPSLPPGGTARPRLTDDDVATLARDWQGRELDLSHARITDPVLGQLERLASLQRLDLTGCHGLSRGAVERLRERLPQCVIVGPGSPLEEAAACLSDAKARLAQAEAYFEGASGPEKAESYMDTEHWSRKVAAALAAWRALAGPDAAEPR